MRYTPSKPAGDYPRLFPTPDQTIAGIGQALRNGKTTCLEILEGCLAQVDEWEPKVHAWVVLDRERAIEQALGLDEELKGGKERGPLHGIPIGIKDIIDVAGLPTACGSKRWAEVAADRDAEVVINLREAGAIIMGKTVTTPYAWIDPPITRNPWNLERTPGGSSSGSAAAVACGMCFGAIGTQTGGSITRPASFCGVAGMKPTRMISSGMMIFGIKPFAGSLDHVGPIARTVDDLRLMLGAMVKRSKETKRRLGTDSPLDNPPRLGRLRGFFDRRAEPVVKMAFDVALGTLASHGVEVIELDDPGDFEQILKDHRRVMAAEAAGVHSSSLDEFPDDYPPRIRELILEGRSLTAVEYLQAKDRKDSVRKSIFAAPASEKFDALITPATVTNATDPSMTGDPAFNSPWSYSGLPTVSFPTGLSPEGLPVAVQLVGDHFDDPELLRIGQWCEEAIRNSRL
jgi:Asp-tRNA(Asn)/Glu-tRNA(Gln) amidotransferase A subunit family amidase